MAQHDLNIGNQPTPTFRSDLNNALLALASNSSGRNAPALTQAGMLWLDTTADMLKIRDENNADWISIGRIDSAANTFTPIARAIRALSNSGVSVQNTAGSEVLKLIAATNQEAIDGVDARKVVTPRSMAAAFEAAPIIPSSITTYTATRTITLPSNFSAIYVQLSGGGGGGAFYTDQTNPPRIAGSNGSSSSIRTNGPNLLTASGGLGGPGGVGRARVYPSGKVGALGGESGTEGGNNQYAFGGNPAIISERLFPRSQINSTRLTITIGAGGAGGAGGRTSTIRAAQDGQKGFATVWVWS